MQKSTGSNILPYKMYIEIKQLTWIKKHTEYKLHNSMTLTIQF